MIWCTYLVVVLYIADRHGSLVNGFNLDTELYTRYRGEAESMFGFSVAMHREAGSSWVLVGAPTAQTRQPGVSRGGAVYSCEISRDDVCEQITFDRTGNNNNSIGDQIDMKTQQWFGASIFSSGEDGPVVACAPRYIYYSILAPSRRDPVGTCYVAKNQFREFSEYSPCRTRNWGYHRQGSCQAGLGVSISKDGKRLFIGAVGSRYWQGQMISQSLHARPDVLSTQEGPVTDDDSYLGYSVTVGDFGGTAPGHGDVAVGMPRGAGLHGQVVLYTWNLTNIKNITGEQLGAYFGYALASGDIDGDGRDDLIIGAPLYTDLNNNEGKYETGRVYIIYQGTGQIIFDQLHIKDGKNSKGRFGLSLTSLGDVNRDGFGDFAVGAPYDGPDERGAVYLFHGSAAGVRDSHSQVIYSEDIVGSPSTFGFSLSGGLDLDENEYPDLVIGAYESNTAVYLRARPVVKVDASISFSSDQIALEEKNCTLKDRVTKVPCVQLSSCLLYDGIGVDRRLDFEIQFVLDAKKPKNPRMFFVSEENRHVMNQSLRLDKGERFCKDMFVYLKPNIRDKLTSLDAEIRYSLLGNYSHSRRLARLLTPILDLNKELSRRDSLTIRKNCGKDNVCIPDLRLIADPSVKRYLLGSGERLALNVLVQNEGEDAFEATFETYIPPGLNYVKIERLDDAEKEIPVQCSAPSFINNNTLHCDIGNPLPREKLVEFRVILQPYHQDGMKPRYEFEMRVNSTNPENSTSVSDNWKHITVPIWVETDLIVHGSSHPEDVHYNGSLYDKTDNFTHENEVGPQVIHVYGIRNRGPSDIVEAEAYFLWPSRTLAGDHLLYLLEQPETLGNMRCEYVEDVNENNIMLDKKRKSFLAHYAEGGVQAGLTSTRTSASTSTSSHSTSSSSTTVQETYHKSSSSSSTSVGGKSNKSGKSMSEEERKILKEAEIKREEEEAMRERQDNSGRPSKKLNDNNDKIERTHYSSNGGRLESESHSRPVYVEERGRVEVSRAPVVSEESYFKNRNWQGGQSGGGRVEGVGLSGGGGIRTHTYYEEKSDVSNTTWKSGQTPKTVSSHAWKTVEDGVEKSGGSTRVHSGGGTLNLSEMGLATAGSNRRYSLGGSGRGRTYTEERHYEKNSTWSSRDGQPIVSESSSWRTNDDGVIRTGGSRSGIAAQGESFRGSVQQGGELFRGTAQQGGETFRGTAQQGGESFRSTVQGGESFRGTVQGGESFRGTEQKGGESFRGTVQQGGESFRGIAQQGGQSFRGVTQAESHEEKYKETNRHLSGSVAHGRHNIGAHDSRTTQQGLNSESSRGAIGLEGDKRYSEERHHSSSSSWSSGRQGETNVDEDLRGTVRGADGTYVEDRRTEHRAGSGDRGTYGGRGTTEYSGSNRGHEGHHAGTESRVIEGGTSYTGSTHHIRPDDRTGASWGSERRDSVSTSGVQEGSKRTEGRHQVHWSSGKSEVGGSREMDITQTGENIRGILGHGHGAGAQEGSGRTYTEERHKEWNTTWSSATGGRPRTTELTSWKINEDGTVRNGSHINVYDGVAHIDKNLNKHITLTNVGSGGMEVDKNLIQTGAGGRVYSEEKEVNYNTTWKGGSPVTKTQSSWRINKDGVVTSGSSNDEFQGTPPPFDGEASGRRESTFETRQITEGGRIDHTHGHSSHFDREVNGAGRQHGSRRGYEDASGSQSSHSDRELVGAEKEHGSSQGYEGATRSSHSSFSGSSNKRYEESEGKRTHEGAIHRATNVNVGDLMKSSGVSSGGSSSQSGSFNQWGEIARGPGDGVARTHTLDLGIQTASSGGTRHHGHSSHAGAGHSVSETRGHTRGGSFDADEESRRSEAEEGSSAHSHRDSDHLSRHGGKSGYSRSSSWSYSSTSGLANGDSAQHGGAYAPRTYSEHSSSSRHSSEDSSRDKMQLSPRYKRQVSEDGDVDLEKSLHCGPTDCTKIRCTLGPLKKDEEAWIAFRSRLWVPTIRKLSTSVEVELSSLTAARVTLLPHIGRPDVVTTHTQEVKSLVIPPGSGVKPDIVPLWVVVLSACAGTLILILLVYLLYKCGFFKRNRPSSAPEKQPLNRNGLYHGDEAL